MAFSLNDMSRAFGHLEDDPQEWYCENILAIIGLFFIFSPVQLFRLLSGSMISFGKLFSYTMLWMASVSFYSHI